MPQSKEDFFRCIYADNDLRISGKRAIAGDLALWDRNEALCEQEAALIRALPAQLRHPVVFIVGVPRSGTTVLSQLMASCLDMAYIPNAVARYWMVPVYGMKQYMETHGGFERSNKYSSFLGNTGSPHAPSEFGWFWQYHLGFDGCDELKENQAERVDWDGMSKALAGIIHYTQQTLLIKALVYTNFIIDTLAKLLPTSLFIHVERSPVFTCQSLLESRKRRYGSFEHWWSIRPRDWESWLMERPEVQVARQYLHTHKRISDQLQSLGTHRVLHVAYESLVRDTEKIMDEIAGFTNSEKRPFPEFEVKDSNTLRLQDESIEWIKAELKNTTHVD